MSLPSSGARRHDRRRRQFGCCYGAGQAGLPDLPAMSSICTSITSARELARKAYRLADFRRIDRPRPPVAIRQSAPRNQPGGRALTNGRRAITISHSPASAARRINPQLLPPRDLASEPETLKAQGHVLSPTLRKARDSPQADSRPSAVRTRRYGTTARSPRASFRESHQARCPNPRR